jgi:hypothetical protein
LKVESRYSEFQGFENSFGLSKFEQLTSEQPAIKQLNQLYIITDHAYYQTMEQKFDKFYL